MDDLRPSIIAYIRNAGPLRIQEFRLRKMEEAAQTAMNRITNAHVASSCYYVERFYQAVIELEDLKE